MIPISAQVSLYPLGREDFIEPIDAFIEVVAKSGLDYEVHSMSTVITGDDEEVYRVIQAAYTRAVTYGQAVMVLTVTNACPIAPPGEMS
jgi:uncharacterized protein YqgV (UPF0045/DUF77 family)